MDSKMIKRITREDAQEISHKLDILAHEADLQEDYGITKEQAQALADSVPMAGGEWTIPAESAHAARGPIEPQDFRRNQQARRPPGAPDRGPTK